MLIHYKEALYQVYGPLSLSQGLASQNVARFLLVLLQEEFKEMIEDAGFSRVTYENLFFGVAAIHSGFKL